MKKIKIGVIGLGYVGLPLAIEFGKKYQTIGFDINQTRVSELLRGIDSTLEIEKEQLISTLKNNLFVITCEEEKLKSCNFYIITVPTPTDKNNRPVLTPLMKASKTVAKFLKKNDIVVYESTVFPGCTEEDCVPVLEEISGLKFNKDFFCGYSPERINPGDKDHTVTKILKVTSGSNKDSALIIDKVYNSIISAGTHLASSIKVAEAAKVIENSQRDINIAFVNELSKIFNLLNIDTNEVLEAASTKWNFLNFKPGLVGGHCIGVDPYYLAQKAIEVGYNPEIILAGRRLNDSMGVYVANLIIKNLIKKEFQVKGSKILILGITFKENCPDTRNSKVPDIINELKDFGLLVDVYDPWVNDPKSNIELKNNLDNTIYDSILVAVAHDCFVKLDYNLILNKKGFVFDLKGILNKNKNIIRL